jgi:hypothetical protein
MTSVNNLEANRSRVANLAAKQTPRLKNISDKLPFPKPKEDFYQYGIGSA